MTNWSQPHTVKSNARRAARKAGIDPARVERFVKAGKALYRFPMWAEKPKAGKPAKPQDTNGLRRMGAEDKTKAKSAKVKATKSATKRAAPKVAPGKSTESQTKALAGTKASGSKFETVAKLLRRPGGASMTEVVAITCWKPHSARARISVDVSKLLGKDEAIERRRENGISHYAIVKSKQMALPIAEPKAA